MTEKELKALHFISNYIQIVGHNPTVREIGNHLEFKSSSSAHALLKNLKDNGYVVSLLQTPRSLRLTALGEKEIESIE